MSVRALKQMCLEDKYSKREVTHNLYKEVLSDSDIDDVVPEMFAAIKHYTNKIHFIGDKTWDYKNKRVSKLIAANEPYEIVTAIMVAIYQLNGKTQEIHATLNSIATKLKGFNELIDAVRTAAELLAVCQPAGAYRIIEPAESPTGVMSIEPYYIPSDGMRKLMAEVMYLPPMLVPPKEINSNSDSGHLNPDFESVILKRYNHHDEWIDLEPLNIANQVEWKLNEEILEMFEELPTKDIETSEQLLNFLLMRNTSQDVYKMLLEEGNSFYLSWRFDKRLRMYSKGYHVNIQSTEYKKAIMDFAESYTIEME